MTPSEAPDDGGAGRGPTIFTVGHGARPAESLMEELRGAGVRRLVDVRTAPGSRKHPQFNRSSLERTVPEAGIAYEWRKDLGGFRTPVPRSPNTAIRNESFRGYADYMATPAFDQALEWLVQTSTDTPTAVMCSETLWWRCHRRLIADALALRGIEVIHLLGGKREPHHMHPNARAEARRLVYDVADPQATLELGDQPRRPRSDASARSNASSGSSSAASSGASSS